MNSLNVGIPKQNLVITPKALLEAAKANAKVASYMEAVNDTAQNLAEKVQKQLLRDNFPVKVYLTVMEIGPAHIVAGALAQMGYTASVVDEEDEDGDPDRYLKIEE